MWELAVCDYQLFIVQFGILTIFFLDFLHFWKVILVCFPGSRNSAWSVLTWVMKQGLQVHVCRHKAPVFSAQAFSLKPPQQVITTLKALLWE